MKYTKKETILKKKYHNEYKKFLDMMDYKTFNQYLKQKKSEERMIKEFRK